MKTIETKSSAKENRARNLRSSLDRSFEEDYGPILRFTEVIYLYMVFETYTSRHVTEIQELRHDTPDILKGLKRKNGCGFVEAVQIYFRDHVGWSLLDNDAWAHFAKLGRLETASFTVRA